MSYRHSLSFAEAREKARKRTQKIIAVQKTAGVERAHRKNIVNTIKNIEDRIRNTIARDAPWSQKGLNISHMQAILDRHNTKDTRKDLTRLLMKQQSGNRTASMRKRQFGSGKTNATVATPIRSLGRLAFNAIPNHIKNDIIKDRIEGTHKYDSSYYDMISKASTQRLPLGRAPSKKVLNHYKQRIGPLGKKKVQLKDSVSMSENYLKRVIRNASTHIKSNPPPLYIGDDEEEPDMMVTAMLEAWENFQKQYFDNVYEEYIEEVQRWPKFMYLIYYTYVTAYGAYYKLDPGVQTKSFTLKFNGEMDKLESFIYKQFKHFDSNKTLDELRFWGY